MSWTPKTPKRRTRRPRIRKSQKSQRHMTRRRRARHRGGMEAPAPEGRTPSEHVLHQINENQGLMNDLQWRSPYEHLFLNKEFAMGLVSINGDFLMDLGDGLKMDREVVLAAVRNNGLAIQYAGDGLKRDREIAKAAIQQNAGAIYEIDPSLFDDDELMNIAIKSDASAIQLHSKFQKNPERVPNILEAITRDPRVIGAMPLVTEDTIKLKLAHMRLALAKAYEHPSGRDASGIGDIPFDILKSLQEYLTIIRLASFIRQSTFCQLCNPSPEFQRLQDRLEQAPVPVPLPGPEPEPE